MSCRRYSLRLEVMRERENGRYPQLRGAPWWDATRNESAVVMIDPTSLEI